MAAYWPHAKSKLRGLFQPHLFCLLSLLLLKCVFYHGRGLYCFVHCYICSSLKSCVPRKYVLSEGKNGQLPGSISCPPRPLSWLCAGHAEPFTFPLTSPCSHVSGPWHVLLPGSEKFLPILFSWLAPPFCLGLPWEAFSGPQTWQKCPIYVPPDARQLSLLE